MDKKMRCKCEEDSGYSGNDLSSIKDYIENLIFEESDGIGKYETLIHILRKVGEEHRGKKDYDKIYDIFKKISIIRDDEKRHKYTLQEIYENL